MIITNTQSVPNKEIKEILGIVKGNTVRARNIGRDVLASFKNIIGGEIGGYTLLQEKSRQQAYERMTAEAQKIGADAIVNVRFATSMIMSNASEILAYGTAVRLA